MPSHPRGRSAAVAALLLCSSCGSNLTLPGFIRPGANRPPLISQSNVILNRSGQLELTANVFEPDGDGLSINYAQLAGPFAVQQSKAVVGGLLTAVLQPSGPGLYAFRIDASDGFFHTTAD